MPLVTMASAAARMILSVTWFSQTYQLFQPMCGVRASVSPQTILKLALGRAEAVGGLERDDVFAAAAASEPVIWPVAASTVKPFGQIVDGECHRPLARGRNGEQKRAIPGGRRRSGRR